jgi:hypothetical protein
VTSTIECAHCGREIETGYLCEDCSDAEWDSYWDSVDHGLSEQDEWRQDDDRERARDMELTLRGGW